MHKCLKKISLEEIKKILDVLCIIMVVIGYFQVVVLFIPSLGVFYDKLDFLGIFVDSSQLLRFGRICLAGSEPSSCGDIICIFLFPYILSKFISGEEKKSIIYIFLFLPLIFFTYSSTVYVGTVIDIILFFVFYLKEGKNIEGKRNFIIILFVSVFLFLIGGRFFLSNTPLGQKIYYFLFEKTSAVGSLSTEIRYSTLYVDGYAFLHYPITGVGNGNQGFFYNEVVREYLTKTALGYAEIADRLNGNLGIVNGGAFVPAFISGYGILGICIVYKYVKKSLIRLKKKKDLYENFRYMYYIGAGSFLGLTFVSGNLDGNFIPIFVLSIPFLECMNEVNKSVEKVK